MGAVVNLGRDDVMNATKTIFTVDDDPDVLDFLRIELKKEGYEVVQANGQEEAEDMLLKVKPDLAIIDLMMEEKDSGFVLCLEIKRIYPGTPVVILTAVTATTGISFAARSPEERSWINADLMMDKPVRPEKLRFEVRRLLGL
jgi:two-component system, OmpR family, response regulator